MLKRLKICRAISDVIKYGHRKLALVAWQREELMGGCLKFTRGKTSEPAVESIRGLIHKITRNKSFRTWQTGRMCGGTGRGMSHW